MKSIPKKPDKLQEEDRQQRLARAKRLNQALRPCLLALAPPSDITVAEWAETKRRLSQEASAETGAFRVSRTPYVREIMDAFTDPKVSHIVFVAASQVGKSEFINNAIGYIIDEDPSSILFVQPTVEDAREYSELRIAPMIRDCPSLRAKVADPKSRDSKNTIRQKAYPGGILTMCGSMEAHSLASKPIRYLFGDEMDRWATSAGGEGDPWLLALRRQTTFYNAKAVECSTPTIKGASRIEKAYNTGTMERYKSQCPHCGQWHEIRFRDIRFEYDTQIVAGEKTYEVRDVWYCCPGCGAVSDERTMKRQPARWEAANPAALKKGKRSFWLNAFVSPWVRWEKIVGEFLDARSDPARLQVVFNTLFGELWENRGDLASEDEMLARREDYGKDANGEPVEVPEGVLVLTMGVDTQDNRLEYEVVGHGFRDETWGIQYGVIMGRPDSEEVWRQLDELINKTWRYADGRGVRISVTFMDEGGHFTQTVRAQCDRRLSRQVFAIKGFPGQDIPYVAPPKRMPYQDADGNVKGACWQYQIGVDSGKQQIMDDLKVQEPGKRGYCHFPDRDEYGERYFRGLLSERLEYQPKKKKPWVWVKLPGHERNEALDCRDYAMAARKSLRCDLAKIEKELKQARGQAPLPAKPARTEQTVRRVGSGSDLGFDPW